MLRRLIPVGMKQGHGTAFKTDWMNNALYEIASFMVLREATRWRWSHARHHSDTLIVGRDAEIAVTRPPRLFSLFLRSCGVNTTFFFFRDVLLHCTGRLNPEEKTFIPESEYGKVVLRARIYLVIYVGVVALALHTGSILPLMYIGLPGFFGCLVHADLRTHATCGAGGKRARSPAQLPDDLYECLQPLRLLEHELPYGTPHVPAGALSPACEASRGGQSGHAQAVQWSAGSVA